MVIANTHIACAFNDPDIQAAQLAILCLAIQVRPIVNQRGCEGQDRPFMWK